MTNETVMKICRSGDSKNSIGVKIRELRKAHGWTQKKLATHMQLAGLDMTELPVLRIENGTCFVPDYEVKALAKLFGISYATLLDWEDKNETM